MKYIFEKRIVCVTVFLLCYFASISQDSTAVNFIMIKDTITIQGNYVTGNVQKDNEPLVGVSVYVKRSTKGTTTDINGNFKIYADISDTLVFSAIGFSPVEADIAKPLQNISGLTIRMSSVIEKSPEIKVVTSTVPIFPVPYPPPSSRYSFNLPSRRHINTLGKIDSVLASALNSSGYSEKSYYPVKNGFALVTQMEQMDGNGYALKEPERWTYGIARNLNSPWDYIKALFIAPQGFFRVIVILVSQGNSIPGIPGNVTAEQAKLWSAGGLGSLPPELTGLHGPFDISMLVYQYQKSPGKDPVFLRPGSITGTQHFTRSGIENSVK